MRVHILINTEAPRKTIARKALSPRKMREALSLRYPALEKVLLKLGCSSFAFGFYKFP